LGRVVRDADDARGCGRFEKVGRQRINLRGGLVRVER
jgi:hypothetical protein